MTRHWTFPAVAGVAAAAVTVWLVRAVAVLVADGPSASAVTVPALWLLYAAGPAVLCAVPLVLLARGLLARLGRSVGVYTLIGLLGGAVVGVVQTGVLLSSWPWELAGGLLWDMVGLPTVGGVVGGLVAGLVARRRNPQGAPGAARGR
ncbi:hypothetical protein [Cellulomonas xiejunii]|uniref:Uncharacterized protein n=1 Tax=Cellulomonas xiejunii TaxID=2968083 RepID=A0ABY5KUN1_9CELL|nr:hypothetical protein [Cellulomonas xiejunii]MCC2322886.1 hypothetical protein [Cellulomonas xiejunii]UUI72906.1 hypothetical protein NP048_05535 [Cellulomonas xiejunii]